MFTIHDLCAQRKHTVDTTQVGKLMDLRADRAVLVSDWPTCELSGEADIDASALVVGNIVKVVRGAKVRKQALSFWSPLFRP